MTYTYNLIVRDVKTNEEISINLGSDLHISELNLIHTDDEESLTKSIEDEINSVQIKIDNIISEISSTFGIDESKLAGVTDNRIKKEGANQIVNATHLEGNNKSKFLLKSDMGSYTKNDIFEAEVNTIESLLSDLINAINDENTGLKKKVDDLTNSYDSLDSRLKNYKNSINSAIVETNITAKMIDSNIENLPTID